jgi:hypothetical protein
MYLSSGELIQLITSDAYWPKIFKQYFLGKRDFIKQKLDEIATVRNSLAHFRPIKQDDLEVVKQNVKHAFAGIEKCLTEMMQTNRIVPTNTDADWYKNLAALASKNCAVKPLQNKTGTWISLEIEYRSSILTHSAGTSLNAYIVTNLVSPHVVTRFPGLGQCLSFMTENARAARFNGETPELSKTLSLIFRKDVFAAEHSVLVDKLRNLLEKIDAETELMAQDNLARGELIDSARVTFRRREEGERTWWVRNISEMQCEFSEDDPPEYWGDTFSYDDSDFIAGSRKYPWMPADISEDELAF